MARGILALHKAIIEAWKANGLDALITNQWGSKQGGFLALSETEATPGTPFPYVVFDQDTDAETFRMSGHGPTEKHIVRDVDWDFTVYAKQANGVSGKSIAGDIVDEIKKVFGGHPDQAPVTITMDDGQFIHGQKVSEVSLKEDDEIHSITLSYIFKIDQAVKVA